MKQSEFVVPVPKISELVSKYYEIGQILKLRENSYKGYLPYLKGSLPTFEIEGVRYDQSYNVCGRNSEWRRISIYCVDTVVEG